jgi:hypothetical protein
MGKSKAPPPPNYAPLAQAAMMQTQVAAQTSQAQLDWARQQYELDSKRLETQETMWSRVIDDALKRQDTLDAQGAADRRRYEEVYQPLEDRLIKEAEGYTDARNRARAEAAAGAAATAVSNQMAQAREAAQDRLESFGIDPSQIRSQALDLGARIQEAAARAGAANTQREGVQRAEEATGRALRSEALNIGRGYPAQIAQSYGLAFQQGQGAAGTGAQAVQSGLSTTGMGAQTMGTGTQWNQQGLQALDLGRSIYNTGYSNVLDRYKANQSASSGWGSALGLIGGIGLKAAMSPVTPFWMAEEGGAIPDDGVTPEVIPSGQGVKIEREHSPSGGRAIDDVHVMAQPDEFIVPRETVLWVGEKHLQRLIEKSTEEKAKAKAKPTRGAIKIDNPPTMVREPNMATRALSAIGGLGDRLKGPPPERYPSAVLGVRGREGGIVPALPLG